MKIATSAEACAIAAQPVEFDPVTAGDPPCSASVQRSPSHQRCWDVPPGSGYQPGVAFGVLEGGMGSMPQP